MSLVQQAVERLEATTDNATNRQVIAETIRLALAEAMACDDAASEAEVRVHRVLAEQFKNLTQIVPFKLLDDSFRAWTLTVQYVVGGPLVVDQTC